MCRYVFGCIVFGCGLKSSRSIMLFSLRLHLDSNKIAKWISKTNITFVGCSLSSHIYACCVWMGKKLAAKKWQMKRRKNAWVFVHFFLREMIKSIKISLARSFFLHPHPFGIACALGTSVDVSVCLFVELSGGFFSTYALTTNYTILNVWQHTSDENKQQHSSNQQKKPKRCTGKM